jgi:transcriptional regulator with XRE-family HTH domain
MEQPRWQPWGMRLRERRKELGFTQETLADAVGVDQASISSWENGKPISDEKKLLVCEILDCDPAELFDWEAIA